MSKELYFIGVCPPDHLKEEIHGFKMEIRQKYGAKAAFRSSAHITLQMPFKLGMKKITQLELDLLKFAREVQPFEVHLNGFGSFKPRVVFVAVERFEALGDLQKGLEPVLKSHQIFNSTHKNRGFHPHITVAFRDLKKRDFFPLWEEMKDRQYRRDFTAEGLMLYKHNGSSWDEYRFIPFGNK